MFSQSSVEEVKKYLRNREETIAVAESVTSGMLQLAFSTAAEASLFFQGGLTVYNLGQKTRHLDIDPIYALSCNCVSKRIAEEMSLQSIKLFNCDWGIGITGYATPTPESCNDVFAWWAISYRRQLIQSGMLKPEQADTSSFRLQEWYVTRLLDILAHLLRMQTE